MNLKELSYEELNILQTDVQNELNQRKLMKNVAEYHALPDNDSKIRYIRHMIYPFQKRSMGHGLHLKEKNKVICTAKFIEFDKQFNLGLPFEVVYRIQ